MSRSEVHVAPRDRRDIPEQQLTACQDVRRAVAALDKILVPVVFCILLGGTIRDYAAFAHVRHTTATAFPHPSVRGLARSDF
jgi:hypothetical protein